MTKKKILSLLIIIAVLISFPIYSNLNKLPKKWTLKEFQNQELRWQNCYKNFECSTLLVPVDYDKIRGDVFHLKVIRFKATDQRQKLGALIVNPGGPGASAFDYAYNAENIVSTVIREKYDIVGFDERGVGQSDPIRCLTDKETDEMLAGPMVADSPENQRKIIENAKFFASKCKKAAGNKLAHLSTFESAKDMELLRLALKEPKLNYLGKSYGTYLGTLYASLYPSKVGKMILDGAIDPSLTIQEQDLAQAQGFESALIKFLEKYKISKTTILIQIKKLKTKPLITKSKRKLNDSLAILGLASALYDDFAGWLKLDKAIRHLIADNDGTYLLALSDNYSGRTEFGRYLSNINDIAPVITCLDWGNQAGNNKAHIPLQNMKTEFLIFGPYLLNNDIFCKYLFDRTTIERKKIALLETSPILVIGNTHDPATPYIWALTLANNFANSTLITFESYSHTGQGMGNPCVEKAVENYLLQVQDYKNAILCSSIGK